VTPEDFHAHGQRLLTLIADYRHNLRLHPEQYPVMPTSLRPGDLRRQLPAAPPSQPEPFAALLDDLEHLILPALGHFQHPRFFGYFPSNAALASVLGDLLASGLGQLGLSWQSSPALTELEEQTLDWLRQLLGLSAAWQGVFHDTASTATLVALLCARERASDHGQNHGGLQAAAQALVVYVSEESHSSVTKAALLAGFGRDNLRAIATSDVFSTRFDLDPLALRSAIAQDIAAGRKPAAIVASCGTTSTTAFDPIAEMAEIAQEHGLWLHVDAAMAGNAMLLPECRHLWQGVEAADSVVINPHKWLGVVFDASTFYVRDPEHLIRVMSTNPSYLQTSHDGEAKNYRDWGIPLGRRMRALKLWFLLRLEGSEALQARLRRDLDNAQWLAAQVSATANWQLLAPVRLQTLCLRHVPAGVTDLDAHTLDWVGRLNAAGLVYVTPSKTRDGWMVRVSVGSLTTERADVEALWALMREMAEG
jgi:aromatic-L-amino-acid/L-tryptophan decarboxylase